MKSNANEPVNLDELARLCCQAGFAPGSDFFSESALKGLAAYLDLLCSWGRQMNLVGNTNWRETLEKLILDSFHLAVFLRSLQADGVLTSEAQAGSSEAPSLPSHSSSLSGALPPLQSWDLGAGAGLPGLPLRLLWQDGEYWLVEVREKRVLFMENFLSRQQLPRTKVFSGRVEQFMQGKSADLILSRAFMPHDKLLPLVRPHLGANGLVLILANEKPKPLSGWQLVDSHDYPVANVRRYFWALKAQRTL